MQAETASYKTIILLEHSHSWLKNQVLFQNIATPD